MSLLISKARREAEAAEEPSARRGNNARIQTPGPARLGSLVGMCVCTFMITLDGEVLSEIRIWERVRCGVRVFTFTTQQAARVV